VIWQASLSFLGKVDENVLATMRLDGKMIQILAATLLWSEVIEKKMKKMDDKSDGRKKGKRKVVQEEA